MSIDRLGQRKSEHCSRKNTVDSRSHVLLVEPEQSRVQILNEDRRDACQNGASREWILVGSYLLRTPTIQDTRLQTICSNSSPVLRGLSRHSHTKGHSRQGRLTLHIRCQKAKSCQARGNSRTNPLVADKVRQQTENIQRVSGLLMRSKTRPVRSLVPLPVRK